MPPSSETATTTHTADFGRTKKGEAASLHKLENHNGLIATITDYGGRLVNLHVPDAQGNLADVNLGFDDVSDYESPKDAAFGATVGPVANRIGGAAFELNGQRYELEENKPGATLHSGTKRPFHHLMWESRVFQSDAGPSVELTYQSPHGEAGFPGSLSTHVTYTLTHDNALRIDYRATTDQPTPVNLTNHAYFNLSGHDSGSIANHILTMNASRYTPLDDKLLPTGDIRDVTGLPMDFRQPMAIGDRLEEAKKDHTDGYDYNMILDKKSQGLGFAARVFDPASGRVMDMFTTEPAVQLYTGNHLHSQAGRGGAVYEPVAAFCLEAQHYPDALRHGHFPSIILEPAAVYRQTTIYRFTAVPV